MWELDHKEGWVVRNFWTVVLEKTLESPLDCQEIKPVNPKGNQFWLFIGGTDAEAPILWLPDAKNWLLWKDTDAGKNWRQEEKGTTEDEMVGWHHQLPEFSQTHSTESVKPSSHLLLCRPLLLLPSIFPNIRVFPNESALQIRWPNLLELQHQSFQWIVRTDFL